MKIRTLSAVLSGILGAGSLLLSQGAAAHVAVGDPLTGGVKYHLTYMVHHTDTDYSAASGQTLSGVGIPADGTDTGTNLIVDTVGSRSWHDRQSICPGPAGDGCTAATGNTHTTVAGEYGWGHTSRWALIDLNDVAADGYTDVKVTITLQNYDDPALTGDQDLVPGLTVWKTAGLTDNFNNFHTYVNGGTSTNWSDWGASTDLKAAGLAGNYWWAADSSTSPTGTAQVMAYLTLANNGNDYLTAVFGGNELLPSAGGPATGHAVSFMGTVRVEAVPLPAAVWLFGSALAGMGVIGRRKDRAGAPA